MPLSNEQKERRRAATAPAAKALVEDLDHIRDVLSRRSTSRAEIRRLSSVIRRILVDGDLLEVASPRVGKLLVQARDCKPYYNIAEKAHMMFFAAGGAPVFGLNLHALAFLNAGNANTHPADLAGILPNGSNVITMRLDNFLAQKVLCMNGEWISRRAAIKHIANYGSGVHSKNPDSHEENVIALMRGCATYAVCDGKVKAHILPHLAEDSFPGEFTVDPPWEEPFPVDVLDPVLLEVLAAGALLVNSPGILDLEAIIALEG